MNETPVLDNTAHIVVKCPCMYSFKNKNMVYADKMYPIWNHYKSLKHVFFLWHFYVNEKKKKMVLAKFELGKKLNSTSN
jgi:hypothetical protein